MSLLQQLKAKQQAGGERLDITDLPVGVYQLEKVALKFYRTEAGGNMFFVDNFVDGKNYGTSFLFSGTGKTIDPATGKGKYTDVGTAVDRLVMYNLLKESKFVDTFINDIAYLIQENGAENAYKAFEQVVNDNINNVINIVEVTENKGKKFARLGYCMATEDLGTYGLGLGNQTVAQTIEPVLTAHEAQPTNETAEVQNFAEKLESDSPSFI